MLLNMLLFLVLFSWIFERWTWNKTFSENNHLANWWVIKQAMCWILKEQSVEDPILKDPIFNYLR